MYFTDAHEELRLHIRKCLEKEVQPHLEEWEEKTFPDEIFRRFGELGFLGLRYPPEYGGEGGGHLSGGPASGGGGRRARGGGRGGRPAARRAGGRRRGRPRAPAARRGPRGCADRGRAR